MPPPVVPPPAPKDIKTIEELYLAGLRLEQFHNPAREPYPYYEEALRRDPGDYRSNVALGILACKRAMYAEAEKHLAAAVERASRNYTRPKDGEALYYLGIALRSQGQQPEADDSFHQRGLGPRLAGRGQRGLGGKRLPQSRLRQGPRVHRPQHRRRGHEHEGPRAEDRGVAEARP